MHVLKGRVTHPGTIVLDDLDAVEVGAVVEIELKSTSKGDGEDDDELVDESPELLAELMRRAEESRLHPERLISHDEVMAKVRALK